MNVQSTSSLLPPREGPRTQSQLHKETEPCTGLLIICLSNTKS